MKKDVVVSSGSGFYMMKEATDSYSVDNSWNYWKVKKTASFVRTLIIKIRIQKTTLCLDLKRISPSVGHDIGNCRSEKKCDVISVTVAGRRCTRCTGKNCTVKARRRTGSISAKCEGDWVKRDGYTVKKKYWSKGVMPYVDPKALKDVCAFE